MASVVGVRLPALTLPLPATAKDPDKRLKKKKKKSHTLNMVWGIFRFSPFRPSFVLV